MASHLIGYINKEDKPIMGLELTLDKYLRGSPGWLIYEKDRKGVELPDSQSRYQPAVNGDDVKLTLDKKYSVLYRKRLAEGKREIQAEKHNGDCGRSANDGNFRIGERPDVQPEQILGNERNARFS